MQNFTAIGATVAEISVTGRIIAQKHILTPYLVTPKDIGIKSAKTTYGTELYHRANEIFAVNRRNLGPKFGI